MWYYIQYTILAALPMTYSLPPKVIDILVHREIPYYGRCTNDIRRDTRARLSKAPTLPVQ